MEKRIWTKQMTIEFALSKLKWVKNESNEKWKEQKTRIKAQSTKNSS